MNWGALRSLFKGVAWKRLTPHEIDAKVSNGHEFQGINRLRELLGPESFRNRPATYLLFLSDDSPAEAVKSTATWYDARANDASRSAEWRLYYPGEAGAVQSMRAGDLMILAVSQADELTVILAPADSAREAQLTALFGLTESDRVQVRMFGGEEILTFGTASILEDLGLADSLPAAGPELDVAATIANELIARFGGRLPRGRDVSGFIHDRVKEVDPVADPDGALYRWIEVEASVFRLWEDALIAQRIEQGFFDPGGKSDVQGFRDFTMSLRQSRVSRAGGALQLHVARVFDANSIAYDEQVVTEHNEKPDFIFPGAKAYHDPATRDDSLRMLAAKFTLKDRWRQVLREAERIPRKHLLTMDPAVSHRSLESMQAAQLTLVIPEPIRVFYGVESSAMILNVRGFLGLL